MVHSVHEAEFELRPYPWNLEAGSPNVEAVVGLVAACDFIEEIGLEAIHQHCNTLTQYAREKLSATPGVTLHGAQDKDQSSIISFSVEGTPANGVARILSNRFNIMVRSGYHCAQPLHEACGIPETVRASVHVYNTLQDIEHLVEAVGIVSKMGKQSADGP
ncbi:MAG: aminotransferase class V-fold PLP-dependent enzyme [Exilibacterium sp.]